MFGPCEFIDRRKHARPAARSRAANGTRRHHGCVSVRPSLVAEFLPPDSGEWEPVAGGESGAAVFCDHGQHRYAKIVSSELVAELSAERDRSVWLNAMAIPSAAVLDWRETNSGACLITQAVLGVPASELDAPALQRAWPSVVLAVRALHGLAVDRCPFDRTLGQMMRLAHASVERPVSSSSSSPWHCSAPRRAQILDQIEAELPARLAQERAHLVVCHGDLCLPNILVDPATSNT